MKDDRIYLLHIRDAIQHILEYTTPGKESFFADRKTQDAVVRNLEIIGEATKRVSASLKDAHPDVSWKPIAGMRDKLKEKRCQEPFRGAWRADLIYASLSPSD